MKRLLRWLFGPAEPEREPKISQEESIRIARRVCEQLGWPWFEPVEAKREQGMWVIRTNLDGRGCNAYISMDQDTGGVREAGFAPR
jgi:hypothetical protein